MRRWMITLVLSGTAIAIVGCQLIVSLDGNPLVASVDATVDVAPAASDAAPRACGRRPVAANSDGSAPSPADGAASDHEYDFVITERSKENSPGFDLDCADTCHDPSAAAACRPRGDAAPCGPGDRLVDREAGVDNQVLNLSTQFRYDLGKKYEENVRAGGAAMMIVLTGYSGEASDPEVYVSTLLSGGILGRCDGGDAAVDAGADGGALGLDGCDVYGGDEEFVANGTFKKTPTRGKVVDYTLIVEEPLDIWITQGSRFARATSLALEAKLTPLDGGRFEMNAQVGGTVEVDRVLQIFGEQPSSDVPNAPPVCLVPDQWSIAHDVICVALDSPTRGADPSALCSELSFGFNFVAKPAVLSIQHKNFDALPSNCPADAGYTCN